jgi:phenylacetate-CoA ligase
MRKLLSPVHTVALLVSVSLLFFGIYRGEFIEVARGMTYGNFDVPNRVSFVWERLVAGTPTDLAQQVIYRFDEDVSIHYRPLVVLAAIFIIFLILQLSGNGWIQDWKRRITQWLTFVALRLGVFRVANVCPVSRTGAGIVPVLNCQACEMATGACPVGTLQVFLLNLRFPFFLVASMVFFGIILGRFACGWLCPFGMLSDLVDRFSLRLFTLPHSLRWGKFIVLALIILVSLGMGLAGSTTGPFCFFMCPAGKVLGLLPYYVTTGIPEASVTVVSPLQETTGFLCMWWHIAGFLLFLGSMIIISGRVFCSVLCPLGGFLGLFNSIASVKVSHNVSKCTGCDRCIAVCPMSIDLASSDFLSQSDCISCGKCIPVCATSARVWDGCLGRLNSSSAHIIDSGVQSTLDEIGPSVSKNSPSDEAALIAGMKRSKLDGCYVPLKGKILRHLLPMLSLTPQSMATYAKNNTDFYGRLYKDFNTFDFTSLPLLHKKKVRKCSPFDLLARPFADKVRIYGETTGSSGSPTPSFFTEKEFNGASFLSNITPYAGRLEATFKRNRVCVNGLAFGFTIAGMSFGDMLAKAGGLVANIGSRSTLATPVRMADALSRLQPAVITGTPIDFICWMRILKEDFPQDYDLVLSKLDVLLSSAELCSTSRSMAIERYFGINHVDNYACVEGFFSMACPCGAKHVLPMYLTELFNSELKLIGQYGRGRLVFTNLMKQSTPMVRYLLDDLVTISPSKCPWGFKKDIIPHGRWEMSVRIGDRLVNVGDIEEVIFEKVLFGDYKFTILSDDKAELILEEYEVCPGSVEYVVASMEANFGIEVQATLVPFGELTAYRSVRETKPILKLDDCRKSSTQVVPEFL